jgi:small-conductance mechanosensitive channel
MAEPVEWGRVVLAVGVGLGILLVGVGLRIALGRLTRHAEGTRWAWDDLGARLLRDLMVTAAATAGAWTAVLILDLRPGLRDVIARTLVAVVILAVSLAAARLAAGIVSSMTLARTGVANSVTIFANITRAVVIGVGALVLLQSLGVSITPLLTALGVGGLAVALALQDTLANLFAGVHILASKKVEPGDYVRLDNGQEGHIVDINWRNTTIQLLTDSLLIVPNARFADAILTNYHRPAREMSVLMQVRVGYDSDLEHVERVTVGVASEVLTDVDGGVGDYQPLVRFHTFGESSIDFTVILRTREFTDQYVLKHEFVKRLHARYRTEGIRLPLPMRHVTFDDKPGVETP